MCELGDAVRGFKRGDVPVQHARALPSAVTIQGLASPLCARHQSESSRCAKVPRLSLSRTPSRKKEKTLENEKRSLGKSTSV